MNKEDHAQKRSSRETGPQTSGATSPASTASSSDLTGQTLGDFRILRQLGEGGMGRVYLAEQHSLKRKVALKVLREEIAAKPNALERFKAESKTVAQLRHANVVQVYMIGENEGRHFMVLEYVKGKSLGYYLAHHGPLEVPLVLSLMRQVASALQHASELGIVHRDIKPENILLTRKAEVKVADFGLARCLDADDPLDLTRTGSTVGTPVYMSPEQIEGKPVDSRSDLYSFGVTCYEMLAGHTPFVGNTAYEVALKHVRDEPEPLDTVRPDVPEALCAMVHKMLAKDPQARYSSARELLKDIARVREAFSGTTSGLRSESLVAEAIDVPDSDPAMPMWKQPGLRRWGLALGALGLLLILVVVIAIGWRRDQAQPGGEGFLGAQLSKIAGSENDRQLEREEALKKAVEQHLKATSPNPGGVEACIDLGVLYLEQNKVREAEALFKRMDERHPPSAYHFVGRLGLAVTDALLGNSGASHNKLKELFNSKSRDNRVQVLNDYLAKNPEFAKWVNETDAHNVRNGVPESSLPQWRGLWGDKRFQGKSPFKK